MRGCTAGDDATRTSACVASTTMHLSHSCDTVCQYGEQGRRLRCSQPSRGVRAGQLVELCFLCSTDGADTFKTPCLSWLPHWAQELHEYTHRTACYWADLCLLGWCWPLVGCRHACACRIPQKAAGDEPLQQPLHVGRPHWLQHCSRPQPGGRRTTLWLAAGCCL